MQSFRQYKRLRQAVADQVNTGRIVNTSTDKNKNVFERQSSSGSSITTKDQLNEGKDAPAQPIMVGWQSENDPLNPRNWPMKRRMVIFAILWINVFAVDYASGADSQCNDSISAQFNVSEEAETLSPSAYTFGLALGSLFAGPIAETVGRNPVYVVSRIFHVLWLIGAALAPNFGAQIAFRFLAGLSGSILLAIHAASIADLFGPVHRTIAWPVIALASFWGTSVAPVVAAWIEQTIPGQWRWADWVAVILSGTTLFFTFFFLPETFAPILLSWRAKHLRDITGSPRFQSELDLQHTFARRLQIALSRAFHMLTREPIVVLFGAWIVVEYLAVFGFLQGFSYVFGDTYGFERGYIGTCFLAITLGTALWTLGVPWYYRNYKAKVCKIHEQLTGESDPDLMRRANIPGQDLPDPEYRLWTALLAAPAFPISLFWLGWSNYSGISYWSDLGAVVLLGFSWSGLYTTCYMYLLDCYSSYAGSALALITCWRYLASGFINLVAKPMYSGMGVHWVATMLGILALLQMPLPLFFYYYGERIRKRSQFAAMYARPDNPREHVGKAINWR